MLALPLNGLPVAHKPTAAYAAAILHALARDEHAGRRPRRLTEEGLATWERFRHLLGPVHLLELLAEDAAVAHRVPFDAEALVDGPGLRDLDEDLVGLWLEALPELDLAADGVAYVQAQARNRTDSRNGCTKRGRCVGSCFRTCTSDWSTWASSRRRSV